VVEEVTALILDSSALVAVIHQEPGSEQVLPRVHGSLLCTVNAAECIGVLMRKGADFPRARNAIMLSRVRIVDFDIGLAEIAGALEEKTKPRGLSLGDRACLALALRENLPVLTADRHWKDVDVGVEIRLIR
jgi:PIN domain nuclease of toxin-antitoxin system